MKSLRVLALFLAASTLAVGAPVLAHPRLLSATPANGTTASAVNRIGLTFSEPLIVRLSGMDVVMTGMPGPSHARQAMKIGGVRVSVGRDGKTLNAITARPLPAGTYDVNWHAVSIDTHRMTGKVTFTVR